MKQPSGNRGLLVVVAMLVAASVWRLVDIARVIPLRISLDVNEGWNAYLATAAFAGGLYPHPPHFFFNNYPPLSFFIVGALGRMLGDPLVAGRIAGLVAFLALAGIAARAAHLMRCTRSEAAFSSALFVATTLALSHYVGMNDPQFLGQAAATAGVLFLIPEPHSWRRLWLAAACLSAGIFIKHNIVALPLAAVAWLWFQDRVTCRRLVVCGGVLAIAGAGLCLALFGRGFLDALSAPRAFSATVTLWAFVRWIVRVPVFVAVLVVLVRRFPRDPHIAFCAWYAGIASMLGVWFLGGDGVDWNVMFESNWVLCLAAGVALNRLPARATTTLAVAFTLLPAAAAGLAIRHARLDPESSLAARASHVAEFEERIALIAQARRAVFCEDLAMCFWAGRPAEVDLVNLRQHVKAGSPADQGLAWLLDRHAFAFVQLNTPDALPGKALRDALARSYVLAQQSATGLLFVPRP
jgi:hypothetical protein